MSRGVVDSPYVGLVPYTEEEAHFFFGRENDQNVIIANMFAARLTILYGASGVGKSSLLRAGVMRELRKRVDAARAEGRAPDLAVVYFNDWKADALAALKLALQKELAEVGVSGIDAQLSLAAMLRAAAAKFEGDVMFIFDQFEEYFLYHTREVSTGSFAYEFAAAANDLSLPVSFLLSLRDDALSRLDRFKAIIPNLFSNYLRLRHLTRVQAERSVKLPIDAYNSLPAEERAHSATIAIEPHLVTMILEQVRQDRVLSAADGRGVVAGIEDVGIETPYLQLVLKRVWAEEVGKDSSVLRADTLTDLGGADQIVGTHLETVLSGLDDNEKEICARMFRYMVTPGGTKIAHTVTDLAEFAKVSEDNVTGVLRSRRGRAAALRDLPRLVGPRDPRVVQDPHRKEGTGREGARVRVRGGATAEGSSASAGPGHSTARARRRARAQCQTAWCDGRSAGCAARLPGRGQRDGGESIAQSAAKRKARNRERAAGRPERSRRRISAQLAGRVRGFAAQGERSVDRSAGAA
jgi:hypothetical protein